MSSVLKKNHVFSTSAWKHVVEKLQIAQAEGGGIIGTFHLTTIRNAWWGIPRGMKVSLTVLYLGRLLKWERLLQPDIRKLIVPKNAANPHDPSVTITSGEFAGFPHYSTTGGMLSYPMSNLLAYLTGWSVLENQSIFRRIFSI